MPRLFIALRPPPPIRTALQALGEGVPGARWQDDDQLHLIMRYIGEIDRPLAEDVAGSLAGVHAPAPIVQLHGVGAFRHRGRTEAIWAGLSPAEPLRALHAKVDHACVRAGLQPERRSYLPHVTLARFSRSAGSDPAIDRWIEANAALTSAPFSMMHLVLYESVLSREGARYEAVARWPLAA